MLGSAVMVAGRVIKITSASQPKVSNTVTSIPITL